MIIKNDFVLSCCNAGKMQYLFDYFFGTIRLYSTEWRKRFIPFKIKHWRFFLWWDAMAIIILLIGKAAEKDEQIFSKFFWLMMHSNKDDWKLRPARYRV